MRSNMRRREGRVERAERSQQGSLPWSLQLSTCLSCITRQSRRSRLAFIITIFQLAFIFVTFITVFSYIFVTLILVSLLTIVSKVKAISTVSNTTCHPTFLFPEKPIRYMKRCLSSTQSSSSDAFQSLFKSTPRISLTTPSVFIAHIPFVLRHTSIAQFY